VRILLDTHAFIWWVDDDPSLSSPARTAIADPANEVFLSVVSTWEMAIKIAIGKLTLAGPLDSLVKTQQFKPLPIIYEHTYAVQTLPLHHRDPFDRLLIAQAVVENMELVSGDGQFAPYGVRMLW
jgi:PIN domain nuclease of toxin-antitoxin system